MGVRLPHQAQCSVGTRSAPSHAHGVVCVRETKAPVPSYGPGQQNFSVAANQVPQVSQSLRPDHPRCSLLNTCQVAYHAGSRGLPGDLLMQGWARSNKWSGPLSSSEINKNRACSQARSQAPAKTSHAPSRLILAADHKRLASSSSCSGAEASERVGHFPRLSQPGRSSRDRNQALSAQPSPGSSGGRKVPCFPQMPCAVSSQRRI